MITKSSLNSEIMINRVARIKQLFEYNAKFRKILTFESPKPDN